MYSAAICALAGLLLSLALTPVCRDLFLRLGILDLPDGVRKLHQLAVPRVGGIAIGASYLGAFALLLLLPLQGSSLVRANLSLVWRLLPALLIVSVTGLTDDLMGLRPVWKLFGQLLAIVCLLWAGVRIEAIGGHELGGFLSIAVTVLWLLACTNAFNLLDGLDGLAAGVGLFATITILLVALMQGNMELAIATAPLAGALIGFLRYNFNPASIFLGDCGSLSIGFLLGCYAIVWSHKSATLLGMSAPMIVLAVPIVDTTLSIARRFLRRKPIFGADLGHIHHRLVAHGLTPRRAVLLLYCFCAFAAAVSVIHSIFHNYYSAAIVLLFFGVICMAVRKLGYTEFDVVGQLLTSGSFRAHVNTQVSLINLQQSLSRAGDLNTCWEAVLDVCEQFGLHNVQLSVAGLEFTGTLNTGNEEGWSVRIPLSTEADYIQFTQFFDAAAPEVVGSLANSLRANLKSKIEQFKRESENASCLSELRAERPSSLLTSNVLN